MAKFNEKSTLQDKLLSRPDATVNHEGGLAFEMECKTKLVTEVLSSFVEGKFYTTQSEALTSMRKTIKDVIDVDPLFVLKLAAYARREMNLRSVPLFLINEFANSGNSVPDSRKYVTACLQRPDDITELLALSINTRKRMIGNSGGKKSSMLILRGIAPAFNRFDEYQFAKYNREGDVTLKDAILLAHPAPKNGAQQVLFDKVVNGNLATPDTWEVNISGKGASKESWEASIPTMGYMATLKNLRNFMKHDVDLMPVVSRLINPTAIAKSRQYPFRFFSAYKAVKDSSEGSMSSKKSLMTALEAAMETSVSNIPRIAGKSLIIVDVSGSMTFNPISKNSTVTPADVACLFGSIASSICDKSDVIVFADTFGVVNFTKSQGILSKMKLIMDSNVGCATYAELPMKFAKTNKLKYDRIFLFSDMQCYQYEDSFNTSFANEFLSYQREVSPAYLYTIDLMGYGTAQVPAPNNKVLMLAGFSEKLLEFIPAFESERDTLVKTIGEYKV